MNRSNAGRFTILAKMVEDEPDMVARVLAMLQVVPTRCEFLYHRDTFEYVGLSPHFRALENGGEIPRYDLQVQTTHSGKVVKVQAIEKEADKA